MKASALFGLIFVSLVLLALAIAGIGLVSVPMKTSDTAYVLQVLGSLFVIALVCERALEVFVTTWRGPDADRKHEAVVQLEKTITEHSKLSDSEKQAREGELTKVKAALEAAQVAEVEHKQETRTFALAAAFIVGLLVSLFGVRTLSNLMDVSLLKPGYPIQSACLAALDVFLTGCVIAGGSEAIHKIMQAILDVMEATSIKAKASTTK